MIVVHHLNNSRSQKVRDQRIRMPVSQLMLGLEQAHQRGVAWRA